MEQQKGLGGFVQKIVGELNRRYPGKQGKGIFAPLFAKLGKQMGIKQQAAKDQPVGTMQPGYDAASRNTTLLS